MSRPAKIALYAGGGIVALLLLVVLAAVLILPSRWFEEKVRARLVDEIERSSGGRAEIGSFHFDWKTLRARVAPFVLHGTEPAGEAPLFRAESIEVGLKIISIFKRDVDIAALIVEKPAINVLVNERGETNFPAPKVKRTSEKDPIEQILDLAVQDFQVRGGTLRYADRKVPLELRGQNLDVHFTYDFSGPRYAGTMKMERLHFESGEAGPLQVSFDSQLKIERNLLTIDSARLGMPESNIAVNGTVTDFKDPHAKLSVRAVGELKELGPALKLPRPHVGTIRFTGSATYSAGESYYLAGRVSGRGLALHQGGMRITNVSLDSDLELDKDSLELSGVSLKALGGTVSGNVTLADNFRTAKVNARVAGLTARGIAAAQGIRNLPWNGAISGPLELTTSLGGGAKDLAAAGTLNVAPIAGQPPLSGRIEFAYNQRTGALQLGQSHLNTPASRMSFTGTLSQQLRVRLETTDLSDLLPVIAMASPKSAPQSLPVRLTEGGRAVFEGTVTGAMQRARIAGELRVNNAVVQNQPIDSLIAQVQADPSGVHLRSVAAGSGDMRLAGNIDLELRNWKPAENAALAGRVTLRNVSLARVLKENGQDLPVDGLLSVDVDLSGSSADPKAVLRATVLKPTVYGEQFDRLRAEVRYSGGGVEVIDGVVELGTARILLAGAYTHPPGDLKNGTLRFEVSSQGFRLAQFRNVQKFRAGTEGAFNLRANGQANVRNAEILLTTLAGQIALRDLVVDGRRIGDFVVDANTANQVLNVVAKGNVRGSTIDGSGTFQLAGDYPGRGQLSFTPVAFSALQDLIRRPGAEPMPFDGVIEGRVTFSGPVRKPELMTARLEIPTLELVPTRATRPGIDPRQLAFRSKGPIVAELDPKGVHIRSATLTGPETFLNIGGTLAFRDKNPWDLKIDGALNLAVIENFNNDWESGGVANVNATVRGTLEKPQLAGRMELKNASFFIEGFTNGIDQANGTVVFDQNRATIERLTAMTGGGRVALSGFVGYGTGSMAYRLQARADGVRVRYPEGVSMTANASLNLTGSTARSLLSGVVTIQRAGFNPRTDVGGLLAASATPVQTPTTPNEFLRNMALDVRVETVPNLQFTTNMTNDLQAEADLRVRGTAAKPAVLGRVSVNQGEVTFFGNKYTINRGEIGFYNPVRIEPVLDMDLETRVRGIQVNINFSGTLPGKLNFSYRSDPPLQSNEIVALLAVGRVPGETTGLASAQTVSTGPGALTAGANTLVGQAIASPVSSRLQRFFGVSRLKIDPTLQNLDAVPQARITLEQQISRNITLTTITNLADANAQIVRLQWDLNRNWSLIAVREENGLFGVDFLYKKRFR